MIDPSQAEPECRSAWAAARACLLGGLAAVAICGIVLVPFFPHLIAWRSWRVQPEIFDQPETGRATVALWQVAHLGDPIPNRLLVVQRWRLLGPVIARMLQLPPAVHLSLYPLGALAAVWYAWQILASRGVPPIPRVAGLIAVTATGWFFTATGWLAFMDGWVALGLMVVAFSGSLWLTGLACLLLPWADDRFLIGLPAAALLTQLPLPSPRGPAKPSRPPIGIVAAAGIPVAIFLLARVILEQRFALNTLANHLYPPILAHPAGYGFGLFSSLRAAWLLVLAGLWLAWRQQPTIGTLLAALTLGSIAAASGLAYDVSRSGVVVIPLLLWTIAAWPAVGPAMASASLGPGSPARDWFFRYGATLFLCLIAAANLCLPAYHHTLAWSSRIRPVWTELTFLVHPPPRYDPRTYLAAAVEQIAKGDHSAAAWLLSIAESLGADAGVVDRIRGQIPPAAPAGSDASP